MDADGQLDFSEIAKNKGDWSECTIPDLSKIMTLDKDERGRTLYHYLLGMRHSDERTTVTLYKEHALILKCLADMVEVPASEIIAYLLITVAEGLALALEGNFVAIKSSVGDIMDSLDEMENQLDAATDAVLINAYGNLSLKTLIPEDGEANLFDEFENIDSKAPRGIGLD